MSLTKNIVWWICKTSFVLLVLYTTHMFDLLVKYSYICVEELASSLKSLVILTIPELASS